MPHGYECDRCEEFVEEDHPTFRAEGGPGGHPIEQVVVHPSTERDDEFALNEYTLCDECREQLVSWIERGTFTSNFNAISTTESIEFSIGYNSDDDLTDIGGVGEDKAKFLKGAGYTSKSDLRCATQREIADVHGIGNALAARIKADVGGLE